MGVTNEGNPLEEPHFVGGYGQVNLTRVDNLITIPASINPESAGRFTLRVTDEYGVASGAWRVTYAHGQAQIERLPEDAACDLTMDVRPLAALMYGALTADADSIACLDGVTVNGSAEDFLRAFPKRPCGMFEHF